MTRNMVYYTRDGQADFVNKVRTLRRGYDKDGVFMDNAQALLHADKRTFAHFGLRYGIDSAVRGWLETLPGHNSTSAPYEAILAVNKGVLDALVINGERHTKTGKAFHAIYYSDEPLAELQRISEKYLRPRDRHLAGVLHRHRVEKEYQTEEVARSMREIPGAMVALLDIAESGPVYIITNTETQRLVKIHFEASFRDAGLSVEEFERIYGRMRAFTAEDVDGEVKPSPRGLLLAAQGNPSIFFGDTKTDAEAVRRAKIKGLDIEFCAVVDSEAKVDGFLKDYGDMAGAVSDVGVIAAILRA